MKRIDCDLLVVGSGAAGLSAAVTAAWHGLQVVVVEKAPVFGGATAWSGGWMWLPGNPLAKRAGIHEDPQQPRTYLQSELGPHYDAARIDAFLDHAPAMVAFFEQHTALQFVDGNGIPDIHGQLPGAATGGHQLIAAPYDARAIGALNKLLRPTMRETSFMGMPIMAGADLGAFLGMTRSAKSFFHVAGRVLRHLRDLALHGRAMHLVNGVALIGRLAKSAQDLQVQLIASAPAQRLLVEEGAVRGAVVALDGGETEIRARRGVVLRPAAFRTTWHGARRCFRARPRAASIWRCRRRPVRATASGSAKRPVACWPPTWPRPWPGRRSRACRMRTAASATSRTSSTAASPA